MNPSRLETFSDAVIAIIITIMVLELRAPVGTNLESLYPIIPIFLAYTLSFVTLGIYWNNHHHLLKTVKTLSPNIMWANLHLLFWMSLVPFFTAWLGENYTATWPTAMYGVVHLGAGVAYKLLLLAILAKNGKSSQMAASIGGDFKGNISLGLYVLAVALAFVNHWFSDLIFALIAIMWLIPDKRLEIEDK